MIYTFQFFNSYILPIITLMIFAYLIYTLIAKKAIFEHIDNDFFLAIDRGEKLSRKTLEHYYINMEKQTHEMLKKFNTESKVLLNQSLNKINDLEKKLEYINNRQEEQNINNDNLQKTIIELQHEIIKKDAIIQRKTHQLKKYKNGL